MNRILTGHWPVVDPDFGDCEVVGVRRFLIAFSSAFAIFFLVVDLWVAATAARDTATLLDLCVLIGVDVGYWLFLAYLSRIQLVIGERGFRYVCPFDGGVAASWGDVLSVELVGSNYWETIAISMRSREVSSDPAVLLAAHRWWSMRGRDIVMLMNTELEEWTTASDGMPSLQPGSPSHGLRRGRRAVRHDRDGRQA